ncbi:hypothetical protein [Epilithonimonas lactis]|uniref:Uncharacterized protein n=1 Tax=Epilithonimonas lactis TaxID=421072 RepID=A0A085B7I4_9FLAO|nr:hypothetical protein [Epilithonimonas lactis]KFC18429.1 hypothetical protein IO89_18225 [Epilithonimonas lactis]SER01481.1 hypothetical protein SAMN04488097_3657 [Epilithonimonas lactis]
MSRTRIVRGMYTKISAKGHSMYSNENIISNATGEITEDGLTEGIFFGDPNNPPSTQIKAKCLVEFRPHGNWKGEFGFDWIRAGDSGLEGDKTWIKRILGKHYTDARYNVVTTDTNSWTNYFKRDSGMYTNLLKSFDTLQIKWKSTSGNPYYYPVPIVSLLTNDNTAKLSLKIDIQEEPEKLEIKPRKDNTGLIINKVDIPVKKGKYNLYNFLTIKASKPLKENILVDVLADGEICGQLKILANDSKHIKNINVIIVPVKTKLGARINTGRMVGDGESYFKQNLKQALIIPSVRYLINPLDMTNSTFKTRFSKSGVIDLDDLSVIRSGRALLEYLDTALERKYPRRYTNFYKLYIINESYPHPVDPGLITQGFSLLDTMHGVFFNGHDRSTISHETLHAMKLPHTFDGIEADAKFTYKAQQTDNIMDYCHWSTDLNGNPRKPVEGKTLFFWQWHLVNPNNKLK